MYKCDVFAKFLMESDSDSPEKQPIQEVIIFKPQQSLKKGRYKQLKCCVSIIYLKQLFSVIKNKYK